MSAAFATIGVGKSASFPAFGVMAAADAAQSVRANAMVFLMLFLIFILLKIVYLLTRADVLSARVRNLGLVFVYCESPYTDIGIILPAVVYKLLKQICIGAGDPTVKVKVTDSNVAVV